MVLTLGSVKNNILGNYDLLNVRYNKLIEKIIILLAAAKCFILDLILICMLKMRLDFLNWY